MRSIAIILLVFVSALLSGVVTESARAQDEELGALSGAPKSETEFLLCYESADYWPMYPGVNQVYFTSDQDTSVTVTLSSRGDSSIRTTIHLPPHGSYTLQLTGQVDLNIRTSEEVSNLALHVSSTAIINCYGLSRYGASDAFVAIPKSSAGYAYDVLTYSNSPISPPDSTVLSEFVVSAFEDSTNVEIVPSSVTLQGVSRGATLKFRLDAGQSLQIKSALTSLPADLTGSTVRSDHPIVVYGGNPGATNVPISYVFPSEFIYGSVFEESPPVATWGSTFIARTIAPRDTISPPPIAIDSLVGDVVRVLALNENTTVSVNGVAWGAPLRANEFRDTLISSPVLLQTSGPALCAEYAHSAYNNYDTSGNDF